MCASKRHYFSSAIGKRPRHDRPERTGSDPPGLVISQVEQGVRKVVGV